MDFTIHDFRHTCASRLIQNGLSLYEVASILGHRDVQTTQRYAHLECRDVSQRARDIMEALNSVSDGGTVESNAGVVGLRAMIQNHDPMVNEQALAEQKKRTKRERAAEKRRKKDP